MTTWTTEQRIMALRNCAYLMIARGNTFSEVNGEHLSKTYGVPFQPRKLEKLWNEQLDRFEREQLTNVTSCVNDGGDGK